MTQTTGEIIVAMKTAKQKLKDCLVSLHFVVVVGAVCVVCKMITEPDFAKRKAFHFHSDR